MAYRNCLAAVVIGVLSVACAAPAFAGPEPPAGWTDGYVFANGIRIHYWRTGTNAGKPPLVLAHGSSDDGLCWTNLAKEIQDGYDIIMFDARGHGLSDPPTPSDPPDVQVEDSAGLIKELKLERPILMGHSMGSASVAHFAAKYPDVPRAVILEDPGAREAGRRCGRTAGESAANSGRAPRHHPRPQQHVRGDARRRLHEELAEVGTVGVRDLGAVEAPPSPGHGLDQQRRASPDERALREDHGADTDSESRRAGRSQEAERRSGRPASEGKDRAHHGRGPQRPSGEQEGNAGRAAGVSQHDLRSVLGFLGTAEVRVCMRKALCVVAAVVAVSGLTLGGQQPPAQGATAPPGQATPPPASPTNLGSDANGNPLRRALKTGHVSNYDEAKVASFTLPDPLVLANGKPVRDRQTWIKQRRPEILRMYETEIYGRLPAKTPTVKWQVTETDAAGAQRRGGDEEDRRHRLGMRPTLRRSS